MKVITKAKGDKIIWLAREIFVRQLPAPAARGHNAPPPELELAVEALDAARCFYEAVESYSFTQNKETP